MKKTLLFSVALAGLMLGSCSSSDDLAGGNTPANQDGNGYVSLSLNLPTRSGSMSRAENDVFDDGLPNEYAVYNGTLLLFEGATEADATFAGAYDLKNLSMNLVGNTTDNITTTTKITQKINNGLSDGSMNFYAIVVLNNNGTLTVGDNATLKVNGEDFDNTKKISDLQDLELTKNASDFNFTSTGFLMMNAPLSSFAGGANDPTSATVSVASKIDKDHIYATEALARANSSATIYVERALAKVEVTASKATGNLEDAPTVSYSVSGWVLDNTNKKTYYLRNTSNSSDWLSLKTTSTDPSITKPYRFVGDTPMETGVNLYRTYWAKDPNYDSKPATMSDHFNTIGNQTPASLKALKTSDYCWENTFTVLQQNQDVTTRVIIAARIGDKDETFYVVNDNESQLLDETSMIKAVKSAFLNNTDVQAWIKKGLNDGETIGEDDLDVTVDKTAGNNKPTVEIKAAANTKYTSGTAPTVTADITNIMKAIKVATYENGISYYPVRIKHFGDDLTPWKTTETPLPTVSKGAYPSEKQAENYLGRYGVLRNNWYQIDVTGIKKLGSPVVPKVTGDPDDELAAYISVKINVLSWATRKQSAILGQ